MQNNINSEVDLLQGNINRMCVTKDVKELSEMRDQAERRINSIYNIRCRSLNQFEQNIVPPA